MEAPPCLLCNTKNFRKVYLPSENDDSNLVIISGIIESAHELLHRLRSESISPLRSIDSNLQKPHRKIKNKKSRLIKKLQ